MALRRLPIRGEITDSTVAKRGDRWWMYLAGEVNGHDGIQLFSASLPAGAPLAATGWTLTPDPTIPTRIALLAGHESSAAWDLKGDATVRLMCRAGIRSAKPGSSESIMPAAPPISGDRTRSAIWNGTAINGLTELNPYSSRTKTGSMAACMSPILIYADGKWKMWYVAGSNLEDYLVQGFAESADGRSEWSKHKIFISAEEKVFDFCVIKKDKWYEAVFSRVWLAKDASAQDNWPLVV